MFSRNSLSKSGYFRRSDHEVPDIFLAPNAKGFCNHQKMFYSQERFTSAKSVKIDKDFLANAIGMKTSDHPSSIPTPLLSF